MGYLNNSTRTLDAILTRKGREMLARGQLLNINKFALGDDEVDYALWDTSHGSGTDYYGSVIENLPFLEPFDDPDTIMKYKLVTRTQATRTMPTIITKTDSSALNKTFYGDYELSQQATNFWEGNPNSGPQYYLTRPITNFTVETSDHLTGTTGQTPYSGEHYSLTILDASVAFMGPPSSTPSQGGGAGYNWNPNTIVGQIGYDALKEVQSITQTINGVVVNDEEKMTKGGITIFIYGKPLTTGTAKTKLIVTGESSGAVYEYNITITYTATYTEPTG